MRNTNKSNSDVESTLSPTDGKLIKSRLKPAPSPKKISNVPEDKEKLVDVISRPRSPVEYRIVEEVGYKTLKYK